MPPLLIGKRPVGVTEGSTIPNTVAIVYRRVDDALALIIPVTLAHYMRHARSDVGHVIWVRYRHRCSSPQEDKPWVGVEGKLAGDSGPLPGT